MIDWIAPLLVAAIALYWRWQLGRTRRALVMTLLRAGPSRGLMGKEIKSTLAGTLPPWAVYPILRRLEDEGVVAREMARNDPYNRPRYRLLPPKGES